MRWGSRGSIGAGGLVPMLDALFLLLFALLALSDVRTETRSEPVRIRLPEVQAGGDPSAPPRPLLAIEIDAGSRVRLAATGAPVATPEDLDRELSAVLGDALPEEVVVEIRADRDARHGVAVELLQHLRLRGFVDVQLIAEARADAEAPFGGGR